MKFITRKKSSALIKKIESLASMYEAKQLQRQVFVANRIKTMNESIYYAVDEIHKAISADRQITFQYFDWNFKKEKQLRRDGRIYAVSPWALTWDDENYYMIAFDEESGIIKHYRVDKMQKIKVSASKRLGEKLFENFDPAVYSGKTFGMYGGRDEQVTLRCRHSMAGIVVDRFGQDVIMYDVGNGFFEISVKVSVSPLFLTWIMNFGGDMMIVSPDSVIEEYIELARKAINIYQ
ncbi:MAG: helix-turn-helix transcriptional regulator [Anaerovoracaceae bacterium]